MIRKMPANEYGLVKAIRKCNVVRVKAYANLVTSVNFTFVMREGPSYPEGSVIHWDTLLGWAAIYGNPEILTLLLNKGAEIDAQDGAGDTPLALAATCLDEDKVNTLLEHGASVNIVNRFGLNSLGGMLANFSTTAMDDEAESEDCKKFQSDRKKMMAKIATMTKILIAAGADPYLENKEGDSAYSLVKACYSSTRISGMILARDTKKTQRH